jgi:hypothetical protein
MESNKEPLKQKSSHQSGHFVMDWGFSDILATDPSHEVFLVMKNASSKGQNVISPRY